MLAALLVPLIVSGSSPDGSDELNARIVLWATAPAAVPQNIRGFDGPAEFTLPAAAPAAAPSAQPATFTTAPPGSAAQAAVAFAMTQLGLPYVWGGDGPAVGDAGFDCSGLTTVVAYAATGIDLLRALQRAMGASA